MFSFFKRDPSRDWHDQRKAAYLIDQHNGDALDYVDRQLAEGHRSLRARRYWRRIRRAVEQQLSEDKTG